ncbi:spore germination protein [Alicyclobacillaceae bacterium I2511]|nr:spore germination protein [Alicyclobacillaceae bacterium I2511]
MSLRHRRTPRTLQNWTLGKKTQPLTATPANATPTPKPLVVCADLAITLSSIESTWDRCADLQVYRLAVGLNDFALVWLRSAVNDDRVQMGVLEPLTHLPEQRLSSAAVQSHITATPVKSLTNLTEVNQAIADGQVIVLVESNPVALSVDVARFPFKPVEPSQNEPSIHGPQESFTSNLAVNVALVRKRLHTPRLKVEEQRLGRASHTWVTLMYLDGVVNPQLLAEVKRRLQPIDMDVLLDTQYIAEIISDHPRSLFPTQDITERPDRVAAGVSQGRVILMVDGSPSALAVPVTFVSLLTSSEDYYSHYLVSSALRGLRQLAYWTSLLLPSFYVAILSYNQDLVPTPLLITLIQQHSGIPFSSVIEAFLMVGAFEVLREAGVRLPKAVGQSVSVVGTLVIGEAAVNAGIVSAGMVIVVAITGVASFTIPSIELANANRLLQFAFMLAAGLFGIYGVTIAGLLLILRLVSLHSFGVPYLSPYAPLSLADMKDALWRAPWWAMKTRPEAYHPADSVRNSTPPPTPKKADELEGGSPS